MGLGGLSSGSSGNPLELFQIRVQVRILYLVDEMF